MPRSTSTWESLPRAQCLESVLIAANKGNDNEAASKVAALDSCHPIPVLVGLSLGSLVQCAFLVLHCLIAVSSWHTRPQLVTALIEMHGGKRKIASTSTWASTSDTATANLAFKCITRVRSYAGSYYTRGGHSLTHWDGADLQILVVGTGTFEKIEESNKEGIWKKWNGDHKQRRKYWISEEI